MGREKNADLMHRGINSTTLSFRISLSEYGFIKEDADREGITPSEWAKRVVLKNIRYAHSINHETIRHENEVENSKVPIIRYAHNTNTPTNILPIYDPSIHKKGERVLMRINKKLVEMVVPDLDSDGRPISVV